MAAQRIVAFVLAGGEGTRLRPFTLTLPKPALPLAAGWRIIDCVLSNLYNSKIRRIFVLLQYKPEILIAHLQRRWNVASLHAGEFVEPVVPGNGTTGCAFKGTAHAVYECLELLDAHDPELVAVFAADHLYRMDVRQMVAFHVAERADVTVATLPLALERASEFGVVCTDRDARVLEFQEKPDRPMPMPDDPRRALISMGNYLFKPEVLYTALHAASTTSAGMCCRAWSRAIACAHTTSRITCSRASPPRSSRPIGAMWARSKRTGRHSKIWRDHHPASAWTTRHGPWTGAALSETLKSQGNGRWPVQPRDAAVAAGRGYARPSMPGHSLHDRRGDVAPHDGTCKEVVVAGPLAQGIEVHVPFLVAREGVGMSFIEQELEAQFVAARIGIHGAHGKPPPMHSRPNIAVAHHSPMNERERTEMPSEWSVTRLLAATPCPSGHPASPGKRHRHAAAPDISQVPGNASRQTGVQFEEAHVHGRVIAVGSSAHGIEALQQLVRHLPAAVLVVPHTRTRAAWQWCRTTSWTGARHGVRDG